MDGWRDADLALQIQLYVTIPIGHSRRIRSYIPLKVFLPLARTFGGFCFAFAIATLDEERSLASWKALTICSPKSIEPSLNHAATP